ncbi:MAG TPA: NAD(P)-dependent oxidoreductase [Steroidobacteraceae bacterium]|nr:NAD(P)-dependent oxidoreductase [Steroidobacteraceae bacterium]
MENKPKIALLGTGTMGHGMAVNLLKANFPLAVYNRTRTRAEDLAPQGASVAGSPAVAANGAAVVVAMLADDDASRTAWLGPDGALAAMQPGSVLVECSTLSPAWITELHRAARDRGLRMVEAPVTGSRPQADAGQLTFIVGADEADLAAVQPVLRVMSKEIVHLGPVGSGTQLKLINNFLCGVQVTSFAEALAWIERSGLKREAAFDFLKKGAPGSGILTTMVDRMTRRTYEVNFLLRLMAKDLRYAREAAAREGVALTTSAPTEELFRRAQQQGLGEKDMSAVAEAVRANMHEPAT